MKGAELMSEQYNFDKMIEGQDQHYSEKKFIDKFKKFGGGLGYKAIQAAATLFVALKSPDMPKANKLIVLGALGYFIFPIDLIADFLPLVGLTDDAFIILTALGKVYLSITDDMKFEAKQLIDSKFDESK